MQYRDIFSYKDFIGKKYFKYKFSKHRLGVHIRTALIELPQRGEYDEYPQSMIWNKITHLENFIVVGLIFKSDYFK